jgi:hypothetical protein
MMNRNQGCQVAASWISWKGVKVVVKLRGLWSLSLVFSEGRLHSAYESRIGVSFLKLLPEYRGSHRRKAE